MIKSAIKLFSLNGIGQICYGLSSIFIIKYLGSANYGQAVCVLAFTNFCSSVATLRCDIPILYAKDENEYILCIKSTIKIVLLVAFALSIIALSLRNFFFNNIKIDYSFIILIWLLIVSSSFFELILRKMYVHNGTFNQLSHLLVTNYLLRALMPFILLTKYCSWEICIYSELISYIVTGSIAIHQTKLIKILRTKSDSIFYFLKQYKHYPIFQLPSTILDNITFASIVPAINFIFGSIFAGQFAVVYRVLLLPLSFLSRIVIDLYQHALKNSLKCGNTLKVFKKFLLLLCLCALFIYATLSIVYFCIRNTFNLSQYLYLSPVVFWAFIQFIVSPLSSVLLIEKKGVFGKFIYDCCNFLICFCFFIFANFFKLEFNVFIKYLSLCIILTYCLYLLIIYSYVRNFRNTKC